DCCGRTRRRRAYRASPPANLELPRNQVMLLCKNQRLVMALTLAEPLVCYRLAHRIKWRRAVRFRPAASLTRRPLPDAMARLKQGTGSTRCGRCGCAGGGGELTPCGGATAC